MAGWTLGAGVAAARQGWQNGAAVTADPASVNDTGLLNPGGYAITGYPKFDIAAGQGRPIKFRGSNRPIVLYNPHVSPHLSSWYKQGRAVLDYFLASDRYNLIFAPHIMMFERRMAVRAARQAERSA